MKLLQEFYWQEPATRRKFFEDFAKGRGFDALNPNNWYKFTKKEVFSDSTVPVCVSFYCFSHYLLID